MRVLTVILLLLPCALVSEAAETKECTSWGDVHVIGFDNYHFDFQDYGNNYFLLSAVCKKGPPKFEIHERNELCFGGTPSHPVSCTNKVKIIVYAGNVKVTIYVDRNKAVWVGTSTGGGYVTLPHIQGGNSIIKTAAETIEVVTSYGVRFKLVFWKHGGNVYINIYITVEVMQYQGKLCGHCGNLNGIADDDRIEPGSNSARHVHEVTDEELENLPHDAKEACSILENVSLFEECFHVNDGGDIDRVRRRVRDCAFDFQQSKGESKCASIRAFADYCGREKISADFWHYVEEC